MSIFFVIAICISTLHVLFHLNFTITCKIESIILILIPHFTIEKNEEQQVTNRYNVSELKRSGAKI